MAKIVLCMLLVLQLVFLVWGAPLKNLIVNLPGLAEKAPFRLEWQNSLIKLIAFYVSFRDIFGISISKCVRQGSISIRGSVCLSTWMSVCLSFGPDIRLRSLSAVFGTLQPRRFYYLEHMFVSKHYGPYLCLKQKIHMKIGEILILHQFSELMPPTAFFYLNLFRNDK